MAIQSRPLLALIKKNALLKKRNPSKTAFELFYPVFMVGILVLNTFFWGRAALPSIGNSIAIQDAFPTCKDCMTLLVSPQNTDVEKITNSVLDSLNALTPKRDSEVKDVKITTKTFQDKLTLLKHIDDNPGKIGLGLVFANLSFIPGINILHPFVNYSIVSNASDVFGPVNDQSAASITLQLAVDNALFKHGIPSNNRTSESYLALLPAPFTNSLASIWAYYIAFGFGSILKAMMTLLALDKENGTRVLFHSMDVSFATYFASVAAVSFIEVLIIVGFTTILFSIAVVYVDVSLFFVTTLLFALCLLPIAAIVSIPLAKKSTAEGMGDLISLLLLIIFGVFQFAVFDKDSPDPNLQRLCMLFPHVAYGRFVDLIMLAEEQLKVTNWTNLFAESKINTTLAPGWSLIMLAIDLVVWWTIALYLQQVITQEGNITAKPWNFFMGSSVAERDNKVANINVVVRSDAVTTDELELEMMDEQDSNPILDSTLLDNDDDKTPSVEFNDVVKVFGSPQRDERGNLIAGPTDVVAVNGIAFNAFPGEITCILGHNGAGKTTLIKCLMGMHTISAGDIRLAGKSIRRLGSEATRNVGVCPQYDALFDQLTIREHMEMYSDIREASFDDIQPLVDQLGLSKNMEQSIESLSGGQKRRVSIAMALIGSPDILLFDEPTTGLDPKTRLKIWDLFKAQKAQGKTIILTSHSMEESDELSSRIAIMKRGKLQTLGTSTFLKGQFAAGIRLLVTPHPGKHISGQECVDLVNGNDSIGVKLAQVTDIHDNESISLHVNSGDDHDNLLDIAKAMRAIEEVDNVSDVQMVTTSLENVFVTLAE